MDEALYIQDFVKLNNNLVNHNGHVSLVESDMNSTAIAKELYKKYNLAYPKFYKMDLMCKVGLITFELISKNNKINEQTSLIYANQNSSLYTDTQYNNLITSSNYTVLSPAIFVYTLPNIVMGEISIKHKIKGENQFVVFNQFNSRIIYETMLLQHKLKKASSFVFSWIEVSDSEIDSFSIFVDTNHSSLVLNSQNIDNLYKTI